MQDGVCGGAIRPSGSTVESTRFEARVLNSSGDDRPAPSPVIPVRASTALIVSTTSYRLTTKKVKSLFLTRKTN